VLALVSVATSIITINFCPKGLIFLYAKPVGRNISENNLAAAKERDIKLGSPNGTGGPPPVDLRFSKWPTSPASDLSASLASRCRAKTSRLGPSGLGHANTDYLWPKLNRADRLLLTSRF
jgi:hypothetical protein